MNFDNKVIIENSVSRINLLNIISIDFKYIFRSSESLEILMIDDYLNFLETKKNHLKKIDYAHKQNLYEKIILITFNDIFQNAIIHFENNITGAYEVTTIMFKSRYPTADFPSLDNVSNCWMNQVFLRKLLSNKSNMKNIKNVYKESCEKFNYVVPTFEKIKRKVLDYNRTMKEFSNFIVNHPENKIIGKTTFKKKKQSITSDTVLIQSPTT